MLKMLPLVIAILILPTFAFADAADDDTWLYDDDTNYQDDDLNDDVTDDDSVDENQSDDDDDCGCAVSNEKSGFGLIIIMFTVGLFACLYSLKSQ